MSASHSQISASAARVSSLREKLTKKLAQRRLRAEAKRVRSKHQMIRLVIGAGTTEFFIGPRGSNYDGWLITDRHSLDALDAGDWSALFSESSIDRILAEHVIEHWTESQFLTFLANIEPFVAMTGSIRIAAPDGFHPEPAYIESVKPGGTGEGSSDHNELNDCSSIERLIAGTNWSCEFLEYYDSEGEFHWKPWRISDGFIERSARFDERNQERPLSYTSLIFDLTKKTDRWASEY